jgi:hypothetical protein
METDTVANRLESGLQGTHLQVARPQRLCYLSVCTFVPARGLDPFSCRRFPCALPVLSCPVSAPRTLGHLYDTSDTT